MILVFEACVIVLGWAVLQWLVIRRFISGDTWTWIPATIIGAGVSLIAYFIGILLSMPYSNVRAHNSPEWLNIVILSMIPVFLAGAALGVVQHVLLKSWCGRGSAWIIASGFSAVVFWIIDVGLTDTFFRDFGVIYWPTTSSLLDFLYHNPDVLNRGLWIGALAGAGFGAVTGYTLILLLRSRDITTRD